VNAQDAKTESFDVFLCHNSEDKPAVREIARQLAQKAIKPWLDEEQIRPGTSWQTALGQQIESIKSAAVFVGESDVGPWQNQEIQALLSQFVERHCPIIPVVLPSAKTTPKLPWPLANLHRVDFRNSHLDPLKQLIWGITGEKPAGLSAVPDSEKPVTVPETVKGHLLPPGGDDQIAKKRLYPPLAQPPDPEQAAQLEILRLRVMEYWVEGVLKHSLHHEVLISLGKRSMDKAVDAPWKYTVEVADAANLARLDSRDVSAIYDATGLVLILGEPGSGKTTTLLDLARTLLERAQDDLRERVPVVLNLSSWKKGQPLAEWISGELTNKYRVHRGTGHLWLKHKYLLPLLDGLDEVETRMQPDCVAAINAFISQFNPSGLVVCCRLMEYQWLPERLKLNGAICLEPLSPKEVSQYLDRGGPKLAALREAVNADPVLQELAQTPLMLSIMSLACQGVGGGELTRQKGESLEERRKQIFGLYVDRMFQRKGTAPYAFPKEKTIGWLSWLARKMREHSESVFLVEGLQPSWLDTRTRRVAYGTMVALNLGLIYGLSGGLSVGLFFGLIYGLSFGLSILVGVGLGCWSESTLKNGVMSGLSGGLIGGLSVGLFYGLSVGLSVGLVCGLVCGLSGGLIGGLGAGLLNHITLVEMMSWKWNQFWKRTIPGLIYGLIVGLSVGLSGGLVCGLIGGLVSGLVGGFTSTGKADKVSPNQGIKLSRKNALAAFLTTCLIFGLIGGLIGGLNGPYTKEGLCVALFGGLIGGLIVGLNRGGSAMIKHYALRLVLWRKGYTPFNFIKFLDHCARLILLKKVGGGYIFIHRMLLDYFAEMAPEVHSRKPETTTVARPDGRGALTAPS
jgi:DNA polymerase III delta prime subunit